MYLKLVPKKEKINMPLFSSPQLPETLGAVREPGIHQAPPNL
ncbi:hypothetical protein RSAG8_08654, partial [Rhizoctonia solani AG-8 WAC10335]